MSVRYAHSKQRQAKKGDACSRSCDSLLNTHRQLFGIHRPIAAVFTVESALLCFLRFSLVSLSPCKYCFGDCTARSIHSVLKHARIMLPEWDEEHDGDVDEDDWKKRNERGEDWAGLPGPSLQRGSIERTSSYASSMAAQGATSERTGEGWNDEKSIFPRTKTTIYQRASSNAYLSLIAAEPGSHPSTFVLLHVL